MRNPELAANRRPIDRLSRSVAIAALAERIEPVVAQVWSRVPPALRNVVNGTVLGHPLHPAITDAGGVAAILATCTHRGAPLYEGTFANGCVRCPWHGSTFDLADGSVRRGPASFPQPRFDARVQGDTIEVRALPISASSPM